MKNLIRGYARYQLDHATSMETKWKDLIPKLKAALQELDGTPAAVSRDIPTAPRTQANSAGSDDVAAV